MAVTWDPAHKSTGVTLSNGNLTATDSSGIIANHLALCTVSLPASGLWVAEFTYPIVANLSDGPGIGVCLIGQNVDSYIGDSTNGTGTYAGTASAQGYTLFNNGNLQTGLPIPVSGNVIGLCLDMTHGGLYYRVQGGPWNNNALADPTTNTGSVPISVVGTIFFAADVLFDGVNNLAVTANFGATAFAFTQPTGAQTLENPGTIIVTQDAETISASGTVAFPTLTGTAAITQDANTISASGTVTGIVAGTHGNAPRRYWMREFNYKTMGRDYRTSADERIVLEEVVEAATQAIDEGTKVDTAAELAREIKRMHDIRLSMTRVARLIGEIRRDREFKAESARLKVLKDQSDEDEDAILLLAA